ncbi:alpha/beta hydrolase family protein [Marisediminicola senii]|uniref:alpha/beta hydrolase family protein n=1 Tax=Marisediminicola senii TaxID=2711233 RepID=UPI0013ECC832|nr:alpha/beta fold hydrolase [Marisediminicola senii]
MRELRSHAVRFGLRNALAVLVGTAISAAAVITGAMTILVARVVVTPPRLLREVVVVKGVDLDECTVTLDASPDTVLPGRYGLWFSLDSGHAKLGDIVTRDAATVTRRLLAVDFGDIASATRARFSGWFYLTPADHGFDAESVMIPTELGPAPAWIVEPEGGSERWVVLVHGRGVRRQEALRAVPVFLEAGYACLLVSWRNDGEAPWSADRRYALGNTEWRDVDAAMAFAAGRGATDIVLMGWSMGGAVALQALTRSPLAGLVRGVALESPVVDWAPTLDFQAREMRVWGPVRRAVLRLLSSERMHRLAGLDAPLDFPALDFVRRADELAVPILIQHSDDDGYVPPSASKELAALRPDIVTMHRWTGARHAKLWNYDPDRFTAEVRDWLGGLSPR